MAGSIAYAHCDDFREDTAPLTIVTASLDSVILKREIPTNADVRISGYVSHVGSSSMEISIVMHRLPDALTPDGEIQKTKELLERNEWPNPGVIDDSGMDDPILTARFTMVGRDAKTRGSAPVNRLVLESEHERKLFALGEENKTRRMERGAISLSKQKPNDSEMRLVHELYLEYTQYIDPSYQKSKPDNVVWMKETTRQSIQFSFPQERNIHQAIFGGWLMKQAFELAFCTGIS